MSFAACPRAWIAVLALTVWSCAERVRRPVSVPTDATVRDEIAAIAPRRLSEAIPLGTTYNLYDLVVADLDADGDLDVHTLNHNTQPLVLINDGRGTLEPAAEDELGLMPFPDWPEIGAVAREPAFTDPGVYLFWRGPTLVVRAHRIEAVGGPIAGQVLISSWTVVRGVGDLRASVTRQGEVNTVVEFLLEGHGAELRLNSHLIQSVRARLRLHDEEHWPHLRVGPRALPVSPPSFDMKLGRDYHAAAWGDLAGGQPSVYLARGGRLRGGAPRLRNDELRTFGTGDDKPHAARAFDAGMRKRDCPGRQVALVDVDNDGLVDLYVGCGREQRSAGGHPNLLQRQVEVGAFEEQAEGFGLDLADARSFRWLDVDGDLALDLVSESRAGAELRYNRRGHFDLVTVDPTFRDAVTFAVADYDRDGDVDLFATSGRRSMLWENHDGNIVPSDPRDVGLPNRRATCPTWVDVDNDGRRDWYAANRGVYLQGRDGSFEASTLVPRMGGRVRCSWADFDGDGDRDLLVSRRAEPWRAPEEGELVFDAKPDEAMWSLPRDELFLYRNDGSTGRWLQLRLIGPVGNRDGIGARITVRTADGVTRTGDVGEAEGSDNSQGHHRVYFGLGSQARAERVVIRWPDGFEQVRADVAADQLLTVERSRPWRRP